MQYVYVKLLFKFVWLVKKLAQNFTKSVCCSISCVRRVLIYFNQIETFCGLQFMHRIAVVHLPAIS